MKRVFLGLGSNLDDREANLNMALCRIAENVGKVIKTSSVYETEPWGFSAEDLFLNMVVEVETRLKPSGLLGRILMIEAKMGRLRSGKGYSSRIIDIDILIFGDIVLNTKSLVIPHPLIHERRFVLVPFSEIAPDLVHPVLGKDIKSLLKECKDKGKVRLQDCKTARPQDF
ncbi:MAG: 2-amino-4-hydroxy-6-hydroxymethyldihydropteridine diphosphokinase [Bacteroidales bacterium]|jgi:2-amino-4-hydroxy-6-hydroxymethyldihydropteridine diphosphokinase|nr:2-amino-4-hydroxy-6-hydroxymethyldihydropteridine diphosphokinase [Bacteroidales bacterium]